MSNINGEPQELFSEAQNDWDLEKLYTDLKAHQWKDTPTNKTHLRGLLLSRSPKEIAEEVGVEARTVQVSLTRELKQPLESLLKSKGIETNQSNFPWGKTPNLLTRAQYQKPQSIPRAKLITENDSNFYLERHKIESLCLEKIKNAGCLIRLKSSWFTGKTFLVNRILSQAERGEYLTVYLNFRLADRDVFNDLGRFLKWFCAYVSKELNALNVTIPSKVEDYWDQTYGSKVSCKDYFERNLLSQIPYTLVLALDDIDLIYTNPKIADDFFDLLRDWREEANKRDIWKKLRLILAYSQKIYISTIYISPFNLPETELPEFDVQEVRELAQKYKLNWETNQCEKLMEVVGGYPFLVQEALAQISRSVITFEKFLETAHTEEGIYRDHLQMHRNYLQQDSELSAVMKKVVNAADAVELELKQAYQLEGRGLVKLQGRSATPRCLLYRLYFRKYL